MILVPFQDSTVSVSLHKGQLGSVSTQLTHAVTEMFPQPTAKLIHTAADL